MKLEFEKDSSGVLLLCSRNGLKNYFKDKEFNYDFPDGILPLVNAGIVAAIVTESTEEIEGIVMDEPMNDYENFKLMGEQNMFVEENDELYVLSHSEFTQICDNVKGDIEAFDFWDERLFVTDLKSGWAILFTHVKRRKNAMTMRVILQLIFTNKRFPYPDALRIPTH